MSKYIIDVGEGYIRHGLERTLTIPVRINEHEDHWMDTRIPVTPYTEPDTEKVEDEAYQRGLNDAREGKASCQYCRYTDNDGSAEPCVSCSCCYMNKFRPKEQEEEKPITAEDVMRQYLDTFCKGRSCTGCPLLTPDFTCGRGKHFLHDCVSNEEVRRAYAAVIQKMKEES